MVYREFPDSPVVRAWGFHYWGPGLILGWETNISQASNVAKKIAIFSPIMCHSYYLILEQAEEGSEPHLS